MAHEYWLSDENWTVLEVLIPLNLGREVKPGNNRQVISGIPANRLFEETRSGTVQRLFHGRPPLSEISNGPQSGTIDAAGGRPHQQSLDSLNALLYCAPKGLRFWRRRLGRQPWPHAAISPIAARRSVAPTWPAGAAYYSSWFRPLLHELGSDDRSSHRRSFCGNPRVR
jgi:hypothetical protein